MTEQCKKMDWEKILERDEKEWPGTDVVLEGKHIVKTRDGREVIELTKSILDGEPCLSGMIIVDKVYDNEVDEVVDYVGMYRVWNEDGKAWSDFREEDLISHGPVLKEV